MPVKTVKNLQNKTRNTAKNNRRSPLAYIRAGERAATLQVFAKYCCLAPTAFIMFIYRSHKFYQFYL